MEFMLGIEPLMKDLCQRWRDKSESYRPAGEPINVHRDGYYAEIVPKKVGKEFVQKHHYSGTYPATRLQVGLYRGSEEGNELCGVAAFGVPMSNSVFARYINKATIHDSIELSRFVLLDDVPANGETWFLGQCFGKSGALLKDALNNISSVLAFSDPVKRTTLEGNTVMPGHIGTIYQAHNGQYLGRSHPKKMVLTENGKSVNKRMLSKLRNKESGQQYARKWFEQHTGQVQLPSESNERYIKRTIANLRTVKHPGNHAYVWAIGDKRERKETETRFKPSLLYPKSIDAVLPMPKAL